MDKENKVIVVGSVAIDDVETPSGRREDSLGGSAIYFSWACSFFAPVGIVGVAGEDFPDKHIDMLEQRGIDIKGLKRVEGKTFHWQGKYDYNFNIAHTLKTELNVLADFKPELDTCQRDKKYLFLANIDPVIQLKVAEDMAGPDIIAADTMNFWIDNKNKDLQKVLGVADFLLVNDAEARQLAQEPNLMAACKKILAQGPNAVIVKQGEYGVTMFSSAGDKKKVGVFAAPAVPLETIIDPTGAGDSFAGAFMGYLASQKEINEKAIRMAIVMGSVVASFTVEGFSLDALIKISKDDINERFCRLRDIAYFDEM